MTYPSAPDGSAVQDWIESLDALGITYAGAISGGQGGKWACPIHDDEHPSLDVTVGRNGKPIFTCTPCQQGMGQEEFVEALKDAGVSWFGDPVEPDEVDWGPSAVVIKPTTKGGKGGVHLTETYDYLTADGKPNFRVKRYDPDEGSEARKFFVPKRYVPGEGWATGIDGVERTPLYLERFSVWQSRKDNTIFLVEGEKAAKALFKAKRPATTFHGGTAGKVEPDWVHKYGFDLFDEVRLWPDADEAGVERMQHLAADLEQAGVPYAFYGTTAVRPKDDAYDVLARGEEPHELTDADLEVLKTMHRKPVFRRSESLQRVNDKPGIEFGEGIKPLVTPGKVGEADAPKKREPAYETSVSQRSWDFTEEFIGRHFTDENGLLTLRTHYDDNQMWLWEDTHFVPLTDEQVASRVGYLLKGARETFVSKVAGEFVREKRAIPVKTSVVAEVVKNIRLQTITSDRGSRALLAADGGVPFRNGWLDAESGILSPLRPDRDVRWVIPAKYDPEAECPEWLAFLDSIGFTDGTDERRLLRQWIGHLISGAIDHHKGMLLIGPKRAGKGTVLDVCAGLLGDGAVGIQLDSFASDFGMQNLIGKGLATVGDARFSLRTDKAVIERLLSLTGFDTMQINVKYQKPMSLKLGARLMIATNEPPSFIEASDALSTRFLVLNFERSFYGREDLGLKRRVLSELPGIARWALAGYTDLRQQGFFTETKAGLEVQAQMIRDAAPVRVFVEEQCILDVSVDVESQKLFDAYRLWCEEANTFVLPRSAFFRDLNTAFPGQIENLKKRIGGRQVPHKKGVALR